MTTLQLEIELLRYLDFRRNLIVNNVTTMSFLFNFEVDLAVLSKSNYCTAIELKISKPDLRNDLKKRHIKDTKEGGNMSYFKNIKFFYYAVPEELKEDALAQIPSYAGLYSISESSNRYYVDNVRSAKQIHNTKWDDKMMLYLSRLGAMRIYSLKSNIQQLQQWKP